ncbi:MAG: DUF1992 domain-containing protein [Gammaproteobacteria bacterium]|nr:MAG: DUF1992 domain-containing protein [Gammaproteobacteria bacterium]
MLLLDQLAEARIVEAMEAGVFDDLPGAGKPLRLDDDSLVAPDLRMALRVLKNAGYVPPEVGLRREIHELGQLVEALERAGDEDGREQAARRLGLLRLRLDLLHRGDGPLFLDPAYRQSLLHRLERR